MQTMAISKFKAQALKIVDQVAQDKEPITITKRGRPLAQIIPYQEENLMAQPGNLEGSFVFEEDIVSPSGENIWEASS